MRRIWQMAFLVSLTTLTSSAAAEELKMDMQRDHLSLEGPWEVLREHADADIFQPDVAKKVEGWQVVTIPGSLVPGLDQKAHAQVNGVWARRSLSLSKHQAGQDIVLKWGSVRYGAIAWLNGQEITSYAPMGPHTVLLPKGLLHEGENQLLLKVPGWAGLPKSKSNRPLIPTGSGTQGWGRKDPGIFEGIWLEFYDRAYMKQVLAMPDVKAGKVTFRIWFDSAGQMPEKVDLVAQVMGEDGEKPAGKAKATVPLGKSSVEITVPIKGVKAWTPETPGLYVAEIQAGESGKSCDTVRFTFGMRTIEVAGGHYRLNGERLWMRGSNLVSEWLWADSHNDFNQNIKTYIVDEARNMNLNCFRTHTLPPPTTWLDVSDRHGTMILAEFPVLYNYADFKFTPEEYEVFHKNALLDATGWITKLWNHPSIVVWVISNETRDGTDTKWEMGPYRDHVRALDPTRPVLRSGEDTAETDDMHICNNLEGAEGQWNRLMIERGQKRDPARTLSNTEYMNYLKSSEDINTRLLGDPKHPDAKLVFAEFNMEHTEVMRQYDYDLLLPYMYAGWTRLRQGNSWRKDFPTPMAAALHSSMAPMLASVDLFDRNFIARREITSRLLLINETPKDAKTKIDVYVTAKDPLFVPDEEALQAAVSHETLEVTFKARKIVEKTIRWKVPAKEGGYFLAIVTRVPGARPVVSQRVVRAIDPAVSADGLKTRRLVGLGLPGEMQQWLKEKGVPLATSVCSGRVDGDVVVVGFVGNVSAEDKAQAVAILEFVRKGGKMVILAQDAWDWKDLVDFEIQKGRSSRAFIYPDTKHSLLTGIHPEFLKRWNGLPAELADHFIKGDVLNRAAKLLWIDKPDRPVAVSVAEGQGEIVIFLLDLRRRLDPAQDQYDPVAERMLLNLLQR
jgi:hypothetical protein